MERGRGRGVVEGWWVAGASGTAPVAAVPTARGSWGSGPQRPTPSPVLGGLSLQQGGQVEGGVVGWGSEWDRAGGGRADGAGIVGQWATTAGPVPRFGWAELAAGGRFGGGAVGGRKRGARAGLDERRGGLYRALEVRE
jgi:hypothetical protein